MRLDLLALKRRCLLAQKRGYKIAKATLHAERLQDQLPSNRIVASPNGVVGSIPHLLALIEALMQRSHPTTPKLVEVAPRPVPKEPVELEAVFAPVPEEPTEDVPELVEPESKYELMTYQQLYDEAVTRGIPGRSGRNKEGLIDLLLSNDQEQG